MLDWGENNMKEEQKSIIDRLSALVRGNITAARVRYCGVDFLKTCQMVRDPKKPAVIKLLSQPVFAYCSGEKPPI